ncbi:class I adenylate-forming enzyme family protein [Mycobacterium sp. E342]|uniref:class I adenylate-forming enzyme family protein n=2 Tax=unclassified Mycobacterium TaxID=2642494 RepID=UPI0012EAD50A|nr:class I adenylate-forming enzyme family protein [Mycobacterium sp. E342]
MGDDRLLEVAMGKVDGLSLWLRDPDFPWIDQSVGALLEHRARHDAGRVALYWSAAGGTITALTYADVYRDACRIARGLLELVEPGQAVAVCGPNSIEWVLLEYACALAGVVLVPMNPAMREDEFLHILDMTDSRVVLAVNEFRGRGVVDSLRSAAGSCAGRPQVLELVDWAGSTDGTNSLPTVDPKAPFIIQYTSGTTGRPKGAVLDHAASVNAGALWVGGWGHTADDILVTAAPLHHIGGSVAIVLGALAAGSSFGTLATYDVDQLIAFVKNTAATVVAAVPTILYDLLERPGFSPDQLPSLRTVMGGGAYVPPEAIRTIESRFGVECIVSYGQSEAPAFLQSSRDDPPELKATSLGRPLAGRDVRIALPNGVTARDGVVGEICTRSDMRMVGYLGQPEATAEVVDDDGWLHTGDLGAMDENGYVTSHGRARDVIIRGGENIYPDEVEAVLSTHESVAAVAVVGQPDVRWGEVPVGFVLLNAGYDMDEARLMEYGRERLASFKVPKKWIPIEAMPLTSSGKVRRVELRKALSEKA